MKNPMRKITLTLVVSSAVIFFDSIEIMAQDDCVQHYRMSGACADANGRKMQPGEKKLPPGYVMFPNAQGQNVPIKHATTYAQCMRNGQTLGYPDAQTESYCHQHYPH
jgi:hypothetical protein